MKIRIKRIPKELIISILFALNITLMVYIHNIAYKAIMIAFILCFLINSVKANQLVKIPRFLISFLAFIVWATLSFLWEVGSYNTNILIVLILIFVFEVVIYNIIQRNDKYVTYLIFAIIICSILLAFYIISFYGLDNLLSERLGNDVLNSNRAGNMFSTAAIFALYLSLKNKRSSLYTVFIFYTIFSFLSIMILITGSKGSLLDLAIGVIFIYIFKDTNKIFTTLRNILIVIFLLLTVYYAVINTPALYNIIGRRVDDFLDIIVGNTALKVGNNSTYMRTAMINFGIMKFKESPLIGYGLDSFRFLGLYDTYAHSNIIEILVDLGIIGAILYYTQYYTFIKTIFHDKKKIKQLDFALLLGFLMRLIVRNIIGVYYNEIYDYVIFILMLGISGYDMIEGRGILIARKHERSF